MLLSLRVASFGPVLAPQAVVDANTPARPTVLPTAVTKSGTPSELLLSPSKKCWFFQSEFYVNQSCIYQFVGLP